jgi:pyrroline-5-carboxylate reductase
MKKIILKIGFIGAGNMGEALMGALIKSNITKPNFIYASDTNEKRLKSLSKAYNINILKENFKLFSECDIIVLAIKPQQMGPVLSEISGNTGYKISHKKLIISIAAGISIRKLENLLYKPLDEKHRKKLPIVRVMPNTPALVLSGISGMSANKFASSNDIKVSKTILESAGEVIEFNEKDLDAVTAVSGSGPAYVFYLIESMTAGGIKSGLSLKKSAKLTLATVKGAVKLLEESKESAEALRKKVTSPGGTTEAAFKILSKAKVKDTIVKAIVAARKRSKELCNLQ